MNAAGVGMNGEASASNGEQNGEAISNSPKHNDCDKHCSLAVGGARPKVRNLVCNIPNGINPHLVEDTAKVNNNVLSPTDFNESGASCSGIVNSGKLHNGMNVNCTNGVENTNGIDSYLRNNVNCHTTVDKCPLKVRSCSNRDNGLELPPKTNGCYQQEAPYGVTRRWNDNDSSSDTGNEGEDGLSAADECCIYTYKGDQMADLPSSFFSLDVSARGGDQNGDVARREEGDNAARGRDRNGDGSSSPEMDFLEMDFDPGPSCEQDSEDNSDCCDIEDEEASSLYPDHPVENQQVVEPRLEAESHNDLSAASRADPVPNQSSSSTTPEEAQAASQQPNWSLPQSRSTDANLGAVAGPSSVVHRTGGCWPARDSWGHHSTSGDLCSPGDATDMEGGDTWGETLVMWNSGNLRVQSEGGFVDTRKYNLNSALYHCVMAKRLVLDKQASFPDGDESNAEGGSDRGQWERTMIWSEQEACTKQVTQISTSACGATAVINVLLACKMQFSPERVKEGVNTRLRADRAPLPEYLFSRSMAGATHVDIIRGLEHASDGALYARFFPMYPDRIVSLSRWLSYWMKKGAIPIATLNLQNGVAPGNPVPDAWHHQMIFGVGPRGIYLTNPLECVSEAALWPQLCSPSILKVKRSDILVRWNEHTSLRPLMNHPDPRWKKMNVLGQVVNMVREVVNSRSQSWVVTEHVTIPASYSSGITLAIRRESPAYEELRNEPELSHLQQGKSFLH